MFELVGTIGLDGAVILPMWLQWLNLIIVILFFAGCAKNDVKIILVSFVLCVVDIICTLIVKSNLNL